MIFRKLRHKITMFYVAILMPFVAASCSPEPTTTGAEISRSASIQNDGGPFGLDLSAPYSKLDFDKANSDPSQGLYMLKAVPKPAPDFEHYAVVAFPNTGICTIIATSGPFDGDSLGNTVRGVTDRLAKALATKYGEPKRTDACGGGEPFCNSEFWSMAINNVDRSYGYEWDNLRNAPGIRGIQLSISAGEYANPIVGLGYRVNDKKKCDQAVEQNSVINL